VGRFRRTLSFTVTSALAVLALPATAAAFQTVTIEPGAGGTKTLHIVGDQGKNPDKVTITYDSVKDEYVITHDIVSFPPECTTVGSGPPYKELHCPAKGITNILVETASDKDSVTTTNIRLTTILNFVDPKIALFFPPDLIHMDIRLGTGNDKYVDAPALPAATVVSPTPADLGIDVDGGGGNDAVTVPGGGTNTFNFGDGSSKLTTGDGNNTATFGDGNSKVTVGNGINSIRLGDGNSKVYVGTGSNTALFGSGNSSFSVGDNDSTPNARDASASDAAASGTNTARFGKGDSRFTGGAGIDRAKFKAGDNGFSGGPGKDKAKLGAGDDTASGGPGKDKLIGGGGDDHLFGNGGFDVLKGGGGHADKCIAGGGGAKEVGCEQG
jgi:Ca2+-binding RTX toxin-like protein